jgi:hypothetical protein
LASSSFGASVSFEVIFFEGGDAEVELILSVFSLEHRTTSLNEERKKMSLKGYAIMRKSRDFEGQTLSCPRVSSK